MNPLRAATLALPLLLAAALGGEKKQVDGIYTGSARGYKGPVKLALQVTRGKITGVKVMSHRENRAKNSITVIPARIVEKQQTNVDAVTGATVTSKAICRAAGRALAKSYGPVFKDLPDGNYEGTAKGYVGPLTVQMAIRGGWMVTAIVSKHRENRPKSTIRDIPAAIVENQSTKVDSVTGATVTTKAIIKAADEALKKAAEAAAKKAEAAAK
ncbi:MAG: FMN-binding protein [Planctomycetota bacterium]